jgi:KDO2-lipid IV(A) lauroyltransferase
MDAILTWLVKVLLRLLQALPLRCVARLGRFGGILAYWLDARHRRVAIKNLSHAFPEKSRSEILMLARENFRRIGENFTCAAKTAVMSRAELDKHLECHGVEKIFGPSDAKTPTSRIVAIGHFGNFELYARANTRPDLFQFATTYRALRQPALNQLWQLLRERSGCLYFERRLEGDAMRAALQNQRIILGLLADQHGGARGLRLEFFGRPCSTSPAPALMALRYRLPLFTAFIYRTSLAQWRLEVHGPVPTHENGRPRPPEKIMADINSAFETAVRRDPANWFWVHDRWKSAGRPPRLTDKLGKSGPIPIKTP